MLCGGTVRVGMYVSCAVPGSGVTGLAHCDGCGLEEGIESMMNKISQFARGGPDGRYVTDRDWPHLFNCLHTLP